MSKQEEAWQQRLDTDFPKGVIATLLDPDATDKGEDSNEPPPFTTRYLAPRITVLNMATPFSPTIQLVDYRGMASKDVTGAIDVYVVENESPKLVRVTFIDGHVMRWNADVPEELSRRMKEPL